MIDRDTIYWGVCDNCEAQTSAETDEEDLRLALKDMGWEWVNPNGWQLFCDGCAE